MTRRAPALWAVFLEREDASGACLERRSPARHRRLAHRPRTAKVRSGPARPWFLRTSDTETPSGDRRARMIAGFNRGYNGFQQTYRTCTPAASVAIRRYIDEGSKISRDLTARYAN